MTLPIYTGEVPYLTTEQMVELDRAMMEDFKIELIQMMANVLCSYLTSSAGGGGR